VRAMGLTLASPDDICNCCEPHQAPKPNILKPRIFSRELDFHSREWQPPSNTQREFGAKPKLSLHSKKEVESEVGTIIEDEFALPEAAQKPATDKQPNRSLFQCRWTPPHSTCLNVIEDTQKTQKSSVESHHHQYQALMRIASARRMTLTRTTPQNHLKDHLNDCRALPVVTWHWI